MRFPGYQKFDNVSIRFPSGGSYTSVNLFVRKGEATELNVWHARLRPRTQKLAYTDSLIFVVIFFFLFRSSEMVGPSIYISFHAF